MVVLPKLIGQYRVSPKVDPVVLFGWHMARQAIIFVIFGDGLGWVFGLEQSPAPAISPQLVALETPLGVLDHFGTET